MSFLRNYAKKLGVIEYKGVWDASQNSPQLTNGTGTRNDYYIVSVPGATNLDGTTDWKSGDWVIFNGTVWQKIDTTDEVSSVAGRTGAVVLAKTDVGLSNVDNTSDINKPVSIAQQEAIDKAAYYFAIVL